MPFESPNKAPEDIPVLTDRIEEINMPILEIPQTEQMRLDTERMAAEIRGLLDVKSREEAEVMFLAANADTKALLKRAADIASMTARGITVKTA
jgi:hypothetical protein